MRYKAFYTSLKHAKWLCQRHRFTGQGTCFPYMTTWGKPLVQFADIRKMVLRQDFLHCLQPGVNPHVKRHAQGLKSTCMTTKFRSFFEHANDAERGEEGQNVISSFIQGPVFFHFCNLYFFFHTLTNGVGLVDRAFAEICDHNLFTCQSWSTGTRDQCSHSKLATWVNSPVSWYNTCYHFFFQINEATVSFFIILQHFTSNSHFIKFYCLHCVHYSWHHWHQQIWHVIQKQPWQRQLKK